MDSGTDSTEESPTQCAKTGVEECEQLIGRHYDLARERAALEAEGSDGESSDSGRYAEVITEMDDLETLLTELLNSFDENDYAALFEEENR